MLETLIREYNLDTDTAKFVNEIVTKIGGLEPYQISFIINQIAMAKRKYRDLTGNDLTLEDAERLGQGDAVKGIKILSL